MNRLVVALASLIVLLSLLPWGVVPQCVTAPNWDPNPPVLTGVSSWFDAHAQGGSSEFTGACSWPKSTTDVNVAAYTASTTNEECTLCGNCYNVTGPVGSVVVRVIDYCDTSIGSCGVDVTPQWTLNREPFIIIAGSTSVGSTAVSWYGPVACPLTGSLEYTGLSGSNVWYVNVRVSNQKYPLKTVEFSNPNVAGNPFTSIQRYHGNQWYYNPSSPQAWPFTIRVNDTLGNSVYDTIDNATMFSNKTGVGGNFPDPASTPTASISRAASVSSTRSRSIAASSSAPSASASISKSNAGSVSASISRSSAASASPSISTSNSASITASISRTSAASASASISTSTAASASGSVSSTPSTSISSTSTQTPSASLSFGTSPSQTSTASISSTTSPSASTTTSLTSSTTISLTSTPTISVSSSLSLSPTSSLSVGASISSSTSFVPSPSSFASSIAPSSSSSATPSPSVQGQTVIVEFPDIQNSSINSIIDLINAFARSINISTARIRVANNGAKRDLESTSLLVTGLSTSELSRVQDTSEWVDDFNSIAGTSLSSNSIKVSAISSTPTPSISTGTLVSTVPYSPFASSVGGGSSSLSSWLGSAWF